MLKEDIIKAVAARQTVSPDYAKECIETMFQVILDAVRDGDCNINLSPLGKIKVVQRAVRTCANPRTGESMVIPARLAVTLSVGKALRDAVKP